MLMFLLKKKKQLTVAKKIKIMERNINILKKIVISFMTLNAKTLNTTECEAILNNKHWPHRIYVPKQDYIDSVEGIS